MKRQTAKVQQLKGKIASLINLVKLGIKKYVIQLLDLEAELAVALSQQIKEAKKMNVAELKAEVVSVLNQDAWEHLIAWSADGGLNDRWYLAKIRPENRAFFQEAFNTLRSIELDQFKKEDAEEKARFAAIRTPEEKEARLERARMFLPG